MATKHIATTGNDTTGDGSSGNPWLTLAKAITGTSAGDIISVGAGTFTFATATITNRTISGAALVNNLPTTIFDGVAATGLKWNLGGTWTINNIKFQNFTGANPGCFGSSATVANSVIGFNKCVFSGLIIASTSNKGGFFDAGATSLDTNSVTTFTTCLFDNITKAVGTAGALFEANQVGGIVNLINCVFDFRTSGTTAIVAILGNWTAITGYAKNCILRNATGGTITWAVAAHAGFTMTYSDSYLITSPPSGTGNITADPLFEDAANANFNLRPASPCRDTGSL